MKFSIIDDNNFKLYVNNKYIDFNYENEDKLYESLKNILINLKKKYAYNIYGFYEVNVYIVENICTILLFNKKEDNILYKTVDLKIIKNTLENVYLRFNDYFLIKDNPNIKFINNSYYINAKQINKKDIVKLIEHFEVIIDENLNNISSIKCL